MKACFVCPIYDKTIYGKSDFEYGYNLVKSAIDKKCVSDLYFVFSNDEQKDKFVCECLNRYNVEPRYVICYDDLSKCKNPVTIKKFFGIKQLSSKYDYVAAIDCEVLFTQDIDTGLLMDDIWKKETYLNANISKLGGRDVEKCITALNLKDNNVLKIETGNYKYSWWFNEIPIYDCKTINEFFDWLEKNNYNEIIFNTWECFDYLVYVIWLVLEKNKNIHRFDVKSRDVLIESLWKPEWTQKVKYEIMLGTHWTSRTNIGVENSNIYLQFHLDRRNKSFKSFIGRKLREFGIL